MYWFQGMMASYTCTHVNCLSCRVLYNHASELGIGKYPVQWHIPFQYSDMMSKKSMCVSLYFITCHSCI